MEQLSEFIQIQKSAPRDKDIWVQINVHIKNMDTQEVRIFETDGIWYDGHFGLYIWEEGNFSCDCNRASFFARAGNDEYDDECGESRFSINIENPKTGKIFYKEFEQ